MSFKVFQQSVFRLLMLYLIVLIVFFVSRLSILFVFGDPSDLQDYHADVVRAFITGARYDTTVFTYFFLPVFLVVLLPLKFSWYSVFSRMFLTGYASFALFVILLLQIGDFYFFKFFQSHFNLLVFGIIYDDTKAVLESVWTDYPVIRILIFFMLLFGLLMWVVRKIGKSCIPRDFAPALWIRILLVLLFIVSYGLGMRGSLGSYPIEKDDATISPNSFVNNLIMNGVFALKDAYADNKRNTITTDSLVILEKFMYPTRLAALSDLGLEGRQVKTISDALLDTTGKNEFLEKNPPNVVFILMESWAGYYVDLHSKELNLMGALEAELPYCYLFRNFTSCANGTVHTLEGLMVNSPLTPLSQSIYMNRPLQSSVAKVFEEKGYKTSFITGAKLGWRNLGKYVSVQNFQQVEGMSHLLTDIPGAVKCEWGVYDEFLFERVYQQLNESKGKPLFAFVFTTTNHTPYQLPETYVPESVIIPDYIKKKQRSDDKIVIKNLTAYQYTNHFLGRLINRIRNSELGKNTLVVVTGDHNTMALYDFTDRQLLQKYGVPLLMYIPDAYKPMMTDVARFGSHKDVFPTIFNLSLSEAIYYSSGNNLFGDSTGIHYFAVNNYKTAFNKKGAVVLGKKPLYYKFAGEQELEQTTLSDTPELKQLEKLCRAHCAVLSLSIQEQLQQ
jgi:phosphoglycerol transferase MdoB-like AlkP superfamily enzyme